MQYTVLLDSKENFHRVAEEEQTKFVLSIIELLEIPFEWNSNEEFNILDKIRLRKALSQYNVSVVDDMEGGAKIFLERELIAEWKKPSYILKEDLSQLDPRKKLYVEMKCNFSSIFDDKES